MKEWEEKTCIQFVPRTTQKGYVEFFAGDGRDSALPFVYLYCRRVFIDAVHGRGAWMRCMNAVHGLECV